MQRLAMALLAAVVYALIGPSLVHGQIYLPPQCDLEVKGKVRDVERSVKRAAEARSDEDRTKRLGEAHEQLLRTMEEHGQDDPALWYFWGRYYVLVSDLQGADSAFSKVEASVATCVEDTETHRGMAWVDAYNEGITALQANDLAVAKRALTGAKTIDPKEPMAPYYLGVVNIRLGENEEALRNFKATAVLAVDTGDYRENYVNSLFNVAFLHQALRQWDSSVVWYEEYLRENPSDRQAVVSAANAYISWGVALFRQQEFTSAAQAFSQALEKNPYARDAMYNLAQCHHAMANPVEGESAEDLTPEVVQARAEATERMLEMARRLVELDPLNLSSLQVLGRAWQLKRVPDSTLVALQRIEDLQFDVRFTVFRPSTDGFEVEGSISNLAEAETVVPPVTFEFVNLDGEVVATETLEGTTLAPGGKAAFRFTPAVPDIAGWRYRVASGS